ncbi:PREDICTED: proteoglycan 4-like [Fragaria vesca subsp. vesca]|uniref:proteoglycan 4-like n=1 Tax=Fragaria vesca subsp. vesca TaxID=101020 RepID=UPI0002C332C1|nr:PREDICTED: proteoglycan 4-like [Fragaria vesca subsp. vesca]XP_011463403.1 PREDICTED: proteoglycan 4-like [Fragaria vesca subsp. vesca]
MGESIVGSPKDADKMGEVASTDSSNPSLEVSVSFGRFENDSLSWEKWSAFSPNKYLEEVEKCATPGSVAQKKAYFEAHYKRIAARKAEELLEQEKQMHDDEPLKSDDQNNGDQICCGTDNGIDIDIATSQTNAQGNSQEPNLENGISCTPVEDLKEDDEDVYTIECQTSSIEEREREETDSGVVSPKTPNLNRPEELVLVKEVETITADTQETIQELTKTLDNDAGDAPEVKEEKARLDLQKRPQKVTPVSKERMTVAKAKKKSVSPMTKTPQNPTPRVSKLPQNSTPRVSKLPQNSTSRVSKTPQNSTPRVSKIPQNTTPRVSKILQNTTPRVSKPMSASTGAKSAPRLSVTNANGSSLSRSSNPSIQRTKKVPPKSLHMSLSLDPKKSDSATETVVTARKSLIMEQMGDKDIVKRAFKTFQNSVNQLKSSNEEKPSTPKQPSTKAKEPKVSTSVSLPKDNGGSLKTSYHDKRNAKAAPSFGLRSEERAEKKELTNKLAKPNARDAERTHSQPKSKEQKEAEIKMLRQSLKLKATPTTDSYQGQKLLKSTSEKGGS